MIYFCNPKVMDSKIDEEIVIMSLEQNHYYGLEEVGSRIWEILQESPSTIEKLCEKLSVEFDVEKEVCEQDTLQFLNQLIEEKLVLAKLQ